MEWLRLNATSIMVLPALLLALTTTSVIAERETSPEGRSLAVFFITGTGFLLALFLEFSTLDWLKNLFVPFQFVCLLASLTALVQFAYHPGNLPRSRAAAIVSRVYTAALLIVAVMSAVSLFLWHATMREPIALNQLMTLIVLVAFLGVVAVLLHQAVQHAGLTGLAIRPTLLWPPETTARTFRDLALALCIPIVLAAATILRDALFLPARFFYVFLSSGLSLFVLCLVVIYHRSLSPRMHLIGQRSSSCLALILAAIAIVGSISDTAFQTTYADTRIQELDKMRQTLADDRDMLDPAAIAPSMGYAAVLQPVVRVIFARDPDLSQAIFTPLHLEPTWRLSIEERAQHLQISDPTLDLDQALAIAHREAEL